MAKQGARYYYVCNGKPRRWIPLGTDLALAKREWARLEAGPAPRLQVAELLQRYIDLRATEKTKPLAPNSVRQYRSYANVLGAAFPIPATELTAQHVAIWKNLNRHRPSFVNGCIALVSAAYQLGREEGSCHHDPADIKRNEIPPRERKLSDAEFRAIRGKAPEWLQVAMDIGYLTAARPVDIRNMRWDQVGERLELRQVKTDVKQSFTLTTELAGVLARARSRRVLGLFVVADAKGRQITKNRLEAAMRAACEAAGVKDATFRDIRPHAATDSEEAGQDAQRLLGHATRAMTERYLRGRRVLKVDPVRKKL